MLIDFHVDKLNELLLNFHRITGLSISIWDASINQLAFQPKQHMPSFCQLIKSSHAGAVRCYESDKKLFGQCRAAKMPCTHTCHAGLSDTAIPIEYKHQTLGYIIFGQVRPTETLTDEQIDRVAHRFRLDPEALRAAYGQLHAYSPDTLTAASFILEMATKYLWLSNFIEIKADDVAAQIDEYIDRNLSEKLSVSDLCAAFYLSKNKLYALSHRAFGMPIADYILKKRIRQAENLLRNSNAAIYDIANTVGIKDYNYFTKVFKRATGIIPSKYRKLVPAEELPDASPPTALPARPAHAKRK